MDGFEESYERNMEMQRNNLFVFQGSSLVLLIDLLLGGIELYHFRNKGLKEPIFFLGGKMKLVLNSYGKLLTESGTSFRVNEDVVIVPTKNEILEEDNGEWKNWYLSECYIYDKTSKEKYTVTHIGETSDKIPNLRLSNGQAKKLLLMIKSDSINGKKFGFKELEFTKENEKGETEKINYFSIICLELGVSFETMKMKKHGDAKTFSGEVSWK